MPSITGFDAARRQTLHETRHVLNAALSRAPGSAATRVEVDYDGAGDEGAVQAITFLAGEHELSMPSILGEAVAAYVEALLEVHEPGWELNDGSFGTVTLDLLSRQVRIEHNTRYTAHEQTVCQETL